MTLQTAFDDHAKFLAGWLGDGHLLESRGQGIVLDDDFHLVAFAEEGEDGVLVGSHPDVGRVDLEDSVAHTQLARVGCGATRDNLEADDKNNQMGSFIFG